LGVFALHLLLFWVYTFLIIPRANKSKIWRETAKEKETTQQERAAGGKSALLWGWQFLSILALAGAVFYVGYSVRAQPPISSLSLKLPPPS